jgi:hypothetical protein
VTTNAAADLRQGLAHVSTAPFSAVGVWESSAHPLVHSLSSRFQTLHLYWRDSTGGRVEFNGVDHELVLRLSE